MNYLDRYSTPVKEIFSNENKLRLNVKIELEWLYALGYLDKIPVIEIDEQFVNEVHEVEHEIHHDIMAMVKVLTRKLKGEPTFWVHYGLTSQDINDTTKALQLTEAKEIILQNVLKLEESFKEKIKEHKDVVMPGRTHGQYANPVTFGFKMSNFLFELQTSRKFLERTQFYGKLSGAVGTYASLGKEGLEAAKTVSKRLGIEMAPISTQVVSRLFIGDFIFALTSIVTVCERFCKEVRNLQRPEIGEMFESFGKSQVGSSTMPHKRNPHKSERVCGLARVVRSMVSPTMETVALEHERDLTNSSVERATLLNVTVLTDYIVLQLNQIVSGLELNLENIQRNLQNVPASERLMIRLTPMVGRQEAHELVRTDDREEIQKYLMDEEIKELEDITSYVGLASELVDRILD